MAPQHRVSQGVCTTAWFLSHLTDGLNKEGRHMPRSGHRCGQVHIASYAVSYPAMFAALPLCRCLEAPVFLWISV